MGPAGRGLRCPGPRGSVAATAGRCGLVLSWQTCSGEPEKLGPLMLLQRGRPVCPLLGLAPQGRGAA